MASLKINQVKRIIKNRTRHRFQFITKWISCQELALFLFECITEKVALYFNVSFEGFLALSEVTQMCVGKFPLLFPKVAITESNAYGKKFNFRIKQDLKMRFKLNGITFSVF